MSGRSPGIEPAEARDAIAREARRFGLHVPGPALETLALHLHLLYAWNRRVNLTGIRDPADGVHRHVLESLEALDWLDECLAARPNPGPASSLLADLGSGNGYPALPLLAARPALRGQLHERVARKADFLRAVLRKTGLGSRVEVIERSFAGDFIDTPAIVTLRAFPDPGGTIQRLVSAVPQRESRSARRPCVLAWLSREDAGRIAAALSQRPDLSVRTRPLRTHSPGHLLLVRPREAGTPPAAQGIPPERPGP